MNGDRRLFGAKAGSSACVKRNGQWIHQLGGLFYPVTLGKLPYFFISSRSLKPSGPDAKEVKGLKQGRLQKEPIFGATLARSPGMKRLVMMTLLAATVLTVRPVFRRSGLDWY